MVEINEFEGQCAEVNTLARAKNKEINLDGATIYVVNVRGKNNTNGIYSTFKPLCSSFDLLLKYFNGK